MLLVICRGHIRVAEGTRLFLKILNTWVMATGVTFDIFGLAEKYIYQIHLLMVFTEYTHLVQ